MAVTIPYGMPDSFFAGNTLEFKIQDSDYDAATYTMYLVMVKDSQHISITGSASGSDHLISVAPATTANYDPGEYTYYTYFSDGTNRYEGMAGVIEVKPDYSVETSGYDARTFAKKVLDALESAVQGIATNGQILLIKQSCGDLDISLKADVYAEWQKWKRLYQQEIDQDKIANGQTGNRKIYTRF